jgi:hypothetical protein
MLKLLKIYIIINFKNLKINWGVFELVWTSTIKKKIHNMLIPFYTRQLILKGIIQRVKL